MLKTRLLEAVCAVAMLAAVPAFAQSNAPPAGAPAQPDAGNAGATAPDTKDGLGVPPAEGGHPMHHSARAHRGGAMHAGKGDSSQDSAVDRLNDQSYQAAQRGEAFNSGGGGSDQGSAGMPKPSGSGDMNAMPGGSMPDGSPPPSGAAGQGTRP